MTEQDGAEDNREMGMSNRPSPDSTTMVCWPLVGAVMVAVFALLVVMLLIILSL